MPDRSPSDPTLSTPEDFIRSRPAEGALQTPDGRRVTALPEGLLRELHRGLGETGADSMPQLLYHAGYEWGLQDMLQLSQHLRTAPDAAGNGDLWKIDAPSVLHRWAAPFAAAGWGACLFDLSSHTNGITFVELRHSGAAACLESTAAAGRRATAPVCHLYAGLFAGVLSFYDRSESHAVETECRALGHPCCRFIVGPGPLIDQAENARHSGLAHDAIRRLILDAQKPGPASVPTATPAAPATANAAKIPWKK